MKILLKLLTITLLFPTMVMFMLLGFLYQHHRDAFIEGRNKAERFDDSLED